MNTREFTLKHYCITAYSDGATCEGVSRDPHVNVEKHSMSHGRIVMNIEAPPSTPQANTWDAGRSARFAPWYHATAAVSLIAAALVGLGCEFFSVAHPVAGAAAAFVVVGLVMSVLSAAIS